MALTTLVFGKLEILCLFKEPLQQNRSKENLFLNKLGFWLYLLFLKKMTFTFNKNPLTAVLAKTGREEPQPFLCTL